MRRTLSFALPFGLVAGLAVAAAVRSAGAAPESPSRVAVVDVLDVLQNAPAKAKVEGDLKAATQKIRDFAKEERRRFDDEAGQIDLMIRSDPKRAERERALERSKVTSEFDIKASLATAQKAYFDALENLWREVRAEVRKVAQEQGFTIVLTKTEDPLNVRSHEEFIINVAVRNVLYYDAGIDITNTVKARMASRGVGGAPVAPGPGGPGPTPGGPGSIPGPRPGGPPPPPPSPNPGGAPGR